jgi:hypothetical protein
MKWIRRTVVVLALLALVAGAGYWTLTSSTALGTDLRQLVSNQILGAVNSRLEPQLDWDGSEFERPGTLRLKGLTLTAPDGTRIVEVATAEIVLTELPKRGEPIAIERVTLRDGTVRVIASEDGGYVGLTPFVKPDPNPPSGAGNSADGPPPDITEILNLRRFEILNIDLEYDDGRHDEPMQLPGFDLALDITPTSEMTPDVESDPTDSAARGDVMGPVRPPSPMSGVATNAPGETAPSGPAWYAMAFKLGREPGLRLDVDGRFNLNTYAVWLDETTAKIEVNDDTLTSVPGRFRTILEQYRVRGVVTVNARGTIDPLTMTESNARVEVIASGVDVSVNEYRFPLDRLRSVYTIQRGSLNLASFRLDAVGGKLDATGTFPLTGEGEGRLVYDASGFNLQRFLASGSAEKAPKLAGIVATNGNVRLDASRPTDSLSGEGTFEIQNGRFVALPIVTKFADVLAVIDTLESATTLNHRADGDFTVHPTEIRLSRMRLVTTAFAAQITGPVGYDGMLDLKVNAGPFRRAQALFGETLSSIFNKLTPEFVTYRVRGSLGDPKISVVPLGGGSG